MQYNNEKHKMWKMECYRFCMLSESDAEYNFFRIYMPNFILFFCSANNTIYIKGGIRDTPTKYKKIKA